MKTKILGIDISTSMIGFAVMDSDKKLITYDKLKFKNTKTLEERAEYFKTLRERQGAETLADGGEVEGPGTGTSDSVPAMLSDGEFVLTAKAVRGAGGGDRDVGAARMYDMMSELERVA